MKMKILKKRNKIIETMFLILDFALLAFIFINALIFIKIVFPLHSKLEELSGKDPYRDGGF